MPNPYRAGTAAARAWNAAHPGMRSAKPRPRARSAAQMARAGATRPRMRPAKAKIVGMMAARRA